MPVRAQAPTAAITLARLFMSATGKRRAIPSWGWAITLVRDISAGCDGLAVVVSSCAESSTIRNGQASLSRSRHFTSSWETRPRASVQSRPGVLCYSGCLKRKEPGRRALCTSSGLVERAQQYGAICAPELSYCGMQPGSCGPANDAVAALSASAAPNPRAPRYLMTRVFMVVLHSSECVKAEEREGVVRSAAAPSRGSAVTQVFLAIARHLPVMMRAGRSGNAGQCSHGQSKRQYDFGRHVHLLLPGWLRNRWRTPRGVSAGTSPLSAHSFQSSDGLTICAASCSQLRRMQRPALSRRTMTKARGDKIHARSG